MEGDFMSMSFAGNQKLSALSICARAIRMSVLALCGNSGVILLSVKRQEHIDSAIPGRYTVQAPHKAGAGIGVLELHTATMGALASFLLLQLSYTQIMVGWVGAPKGAPVSVCAGYANPAQFTTSEIGVSGGGSYPLHTEAAIMATIPALVQPELCIIAGKVVTSSLAVASYFGKQHKNVIQKIASLECSAEFTELNFQLSEYIDASGRKLPCYQITRDGFAFLAMGFTGKRAAQFKEAYINAFNQMEKQLSIPSVLSDAAHNASVLYSYISSIHQVWLQQLYPMLEKAESPLAVSLYDRINDAVALASLINMTLNRSEVRGRK
ncbi:peptidase [Salmonella enterica subsp. enterica serovar 4,[5],12:i:-]|nr:peptidase [Salmonella enterica subsp. enterica serovar 4,[5],12:i:-]